MNVMFHSNFESLKQCLFYRQLCDNDTALQLTVKRFVSSNYECYSLQVSEILVFSKLILYNFILNEKRFNVLIGSIQMNRKLL